MNPGGQEHRGRWRITWHTASSAQVPGHGSTHLWPRQVRWRGQSPGMTHSGRHPRYGSPSRPGLHVHTAAPPTSRHSVLSPHRPLEQGDLSTATCRREEVVKTHAQGREMKDRILTCTTKLGKPLSCRSEREVDIMHMLTLNGGWGWSASRVGVSHQPFGARAYGAVLEDLACGQQTTCPWTRVHAPPSYARAIVRAHVVRFTFRGTPDEGVSSQFGGT